MPKFSIRKLLYAESSPLITFTTDSNAENYHKILPTGFRFFPILQATEPVFKVDEIFYLQYHVQWPSPICSMDKQAFKLHKYLKYLYWKLYDS